MGKFDPDKPLTQREKKGDSRRDRQQFEKEWLSDDDDQRVNAHSDDTRGPRAQKRQGRNAEATQALSRTTLLIEALFDNSFQFQPDEDDEFIQMFNSALSLGKAASDANSSGDETHTPGTVETTSSGLRAEYYSENMFSKKDGDPTDPDEFTIEAARGRFGYLSGICPVRVHGGADSLSVMQAASYAEKASSGERQARGAAPRREGSKNAAKVQSGWDLEIRLPHHACAVKVRDLSSRAQIKRGEGRVLLTFYAGDSLTHVDGEYEIEYDTQDAWKLLVRQGGEISAPSDDIEREQALQAETRAAERKRSGRR